MISSPIKPFDFFIPKIHKNIYNAICKALTEIFINHRYSDRVLEAMLKSNSKWGSRDRRIIAESVYDITRYWRLLAESLKMGNHIDEEDIEDIVSLYFVKKNIEIEGYTQRIKSGEMRYAKNLNVRVIRESIPDWLDKYGEQMLKSKWGAELSAMNIPADVYIRANRIKTTKEKLQKLLQEEEIETEPVEGVDDALRLVTKKNLFMTDCFADGLFEIQDAASQMVSSVLDIKKGMRVIDACAGAGGKALHIDSLLNNSGKIIALDVEDRKLTELKRRAKRNSISNIETRLIDDNKVIKRLANSADRLLIDAPCSGSGVIRRNPDAKWRLSPERIAELVIKQGEILQNYAKMVKVGGIMVYATCSIFEDENQSQVVKFLKNNSSFELLSEQVLLSSETGFDGFYIAKLKRNESKAQTGDTSNS